MPVVEALTVRNRALSLAALGFGLLVAVVALYGQPWRNWPGLHITFETVAVMLALFAGLIAWVLYRSRPGDLLLLISATYLGTGVLDAYHVMVSSDLLALFGPESPSYFRTASVEVGWLATRLFTSTMLVITAFWTLGPRGRVQTNRLRPRPVFGLVGIVLCVTIAVLNFAPLPTSFESSRLLAQPLELVAGGLFAVALAAFVRRADWRNDGFVFWLVISMVVNTTIQALFIPFAALHFDIMFAASPVLKIMARVCVIIGSTISMHALFQHAESSRIAIAAAHEALQRQVRDRQTAENEKELQRQAVELSPMGLIIYRMEDRADLGSFRLKSVNAAAIRLTGATPEQIQDGLGKSIRETTPDAVDTKLTRGYLHALETGEPHDFGEITVEEGALTGTVFSSIVFPLPDDQLAIFFEDVTERVRSREALRRREAQLADAQAVASVGSWEWDIPANTVTWSDEMYRVYGLTPDALGVTFETFLEMVHPEDRGFVAGIVQNSLETHDSFDFYHRAIRPDGSVRHLHSRGRVTLGPDGQPIRMFGTGQDVTERHQTEQAIVASEAKFRAVAESTQEAIISAGSDGSILYWNPAAVRMFGYSEAEALGLPLTALIPERHHAAHLNGVQRLNETGTSRLAGQTLELSGLRRGGNEFPLELSVGVLGAGGSMFVTATIRDVTARRAAEKANERYAIQLAASNRQLQNFAFIASHDLQEPLRKIMAFGDRLMTKYAGILGEEGADYITRMQVAARRGQDLVDSLLRYSRVTSQAQPFTAVDLNGVARDVLSDLETSIEVAGATVHVGALPTIQADDTQMRQLFQNLISNALKFRGVDQPVEVTINSELVTENDTPDVAYRIIFSDNGIGFEEKYLDRIFQPLQRLHGASLYPGTGMGLAICWRIVDRHGGSITAESEPAQGARFIVILPARQQAIEKQGEP